MIWIKILLRELSMPFSFHLPQAAKQKVLAYTHPSISGRSSIPIPSRRLKGSIRCSYPDLEVSYLIKLQESSSATWIWRLDFVSFSQTHQDGLNLLYSYVHLKYWIYGLNWRTQSFECPIFHNQYHNGIYDWCCIGPFRKILLKKYKLCNPHVFHLCTLRIKPRSLI